MVTLLLIDILLLAGGANAQVDVFPTVSETCATAQVFRSAGLTREILSGLSPPVELAHGTGRAVALNLGQDSALQYLVPMECDERRNCDWAVLDSSPFRLIGIVHGCALHIHPGDKKWSAIWTFRCDPDDDSSLIEHIYRDDWYELGMMATPKPRWSSRYLQCVGDDVCCPGSNLTAR